MAQQDVHEDVPEVTQVVEPVSPATYHVPVQARLEVYLDDTEGTRHLANDEDLRQFGYRSADWFVSAMTNAIVSVAPFDPAQPDQLSLLPVLRLAGVVAQGQQGEPIPSDLLADLAEMEQCLSAHLTQFRRGRVRDKARATNEDAPPTVTVSPQDEA